MSNWLPVPHRISCLSGGRETLQQATQYFLAQGSLPSDAQQRAFAWIGQQVHAQASFLANVDVFWVLMLIALGAVPLALVLRDVTPTGAVPVGH